jgi:hypothetical protein
MEAAAGYKTHRLRIRAILAELAGIGTVVKTVE